MEQSVLVNNTVLGKSPFSTTLVVVSAALTLLFTIMKPEVSHSLSFFPRLAFWFLQITTGLVGIMLASGLLRRYAHRDYPMVVSIAFTGTMGTLLAAPGFVMIDRWFPGLVEEPDGWLDTFAIEGPIQAVMVEFLDVLPALLTTWFVLNLPLLLNATFIHKPPTPPEDPPAPQDKEALEKQQTRDQFYSRLPKVIGQDIISITSDLHYLNVTTSMGNSLILGSLTQIADAFEDEGFLVHRSHWVHKNHVVKVHVAGSTAYCLMSNDSQIPISRSKRKLVKEYFGQTTRPQVAQTPPLRQVK